MPASYLCFLPHCALFLSLVLFLLNSSFHGLLQHGKVLNTDRTGRVSSGGCNRYITLILGCSS
ncbi:hypothetical protein M758_5G182700 [Ceratodon purpureus]|nr:hypothetical protein M758_5G182700 [Ceratodon purpureus]